MRWGWGGPVGQVGRVAWVVCQPTWWCCVQGSLCRTLLLLPIPQKWQLDFGLFALVRTNPNCAFIKLFLVPYSFFVFCCSRCLFRCEHSSKGTQAPTYLTSTLTAAAWCHAGRHAGSLRPGGLPSQSAGLIMTTIGASLLLAEGFY